MAPGVTEKGGQQAVQDWSPRYSQCLSPGSHGSGHIPCRDGELQRQSGGYPSADNEDLDSGPTILHFPCWMVIWPSF